MSISIFIYEIMSLKNGNLAIVAKFLKWSKFLIGQEIHFLIIWTVLLHTLSISTWKFRKIKKNPIFLFVGYILTKKKFEKVLVWL